MRYRAVFLGDRAKSYLHQEIGQNPLVSEIRGLGLMLGIEFIKPGLAARLMDSLRDSGIVILPSGPDGRVLSLTPALNIDEDEWMEALKIITEMINNLKDT